MPTSIVAAATPKISATRSPLLPPSVMVLPSVAHIAPLLVCLVCLLFVACTETTAPVRRYPVLDDIGSGPWGTVTVGGDHTCALQQSGDAYCWGSNQSGQLGIDRLDTLCGSGDAHFGCSTSPQQVQPGLRFIQISAGARHTCAIATTRDASQYSHIDAKAVLDRLAIKHAGAAEDIAAACLYLAGESGRFVTGQVLHINGGEFMF